MEYENLEYCTRVRETLEAYYRGEMYKCPICGNVIHIEDEKFQQDGLNGYILPNGCVVEDIEDLEQLSLYDYIGTKVYDTVYYLNSDKEIIGVRLMVGSSPNIYIDTFRRTVELYWWNESATIDLYSDLCDEILSAYTEI